MIKDGHSDMADVFGRIRARLRTKMEADLRNEGPVPQTSDSPSKNTGILHELLVSIQNAHRQVGEVNPRHPGPINSLIQVFKKSLRRVLTWYTRSIVEFQAATIRFLAETVEILGRDQTRLANIEKKIDILTAEVAGLRRQIQSRPDLIVPDPARSEMEEK
jgi:hypothetical protein